MEIGTEEPAITIEPITEPVPGGGESQPAPEPEEAPVAVPEAEPVAVPA
jgi:hypothetical protein